MKRKFGIGLTVLLAAVMLLLGAGLPAAASNAAAMPDLNTAEPLSLSVHLAYTDEDEETPLEGATMDICKVADATVSNGSVTYTLTEAFKDSGIDFGGMSASASNEAAQTLSEMVTDGVSTQSQVTDANGLAVFNDLTAGMYLVRETKVSGTAAGYSRIEPFLAMVPGVNEEDGTWVYRVTVNPKTAVVKNSTPPKTPNTPGNPSTPSTPPAAPAQETGTTSISVLKRWADSGNQDGYRPDSISVQLYADGVAQGSAVLLSASNGWSYTWTNLSDDAQYTVDEVSVPAHYVKEIQGSAAVGFTIINGRDDEGDWYFDDTSNDVWNADDGTPTFEEDEDVAEPVSSSSTPRTGDDMNLILWIVLILAGSGALAGSVIYRKKRNQK